MYQYITTFWQDFSIAETFGFSAIRESAERFFNEWKYDVKYLTELVMILDYKCWHYYEKGDEKLSQLYSDLYYKYNAKAWDWLEQHATKEDQKYYFDTLD